MRMDNVEELRRGAVRKFLRQHEDGEDCLDIINAEVLRLQEFFDSECCQEPPSPNEGWVRLELEACERLHRRTMKKLLNSGCLEEFKKMKFYYLDEDGYPYNYQGLVRKGTRKWATDEVAPF